MSVGDVTGGKEINPLWTSQVSWDGFVDALEQTFAAHAMLATDTGDYQLDAELVKLKQPLVGVDMTVTSDVKYTLTNMKTGQILFDEVISEKYTAKFGDSFVGVKRLQLANEGSIKSNLSSMITSMINQVDGLGTPIAFIDLSKSHG